MEITRITTHGGSPRACFSIRYLQLIYTSSHSRFRLPNTGHFYYEMLLSNRVDIFMFFKSLEQSYTLNSRFLCRMKKSFASYLPTELKIKISLFVVWSNKWRCEMSNLT